MSNISLTEKQVSWWIIGLLIFLHCTGLTVTIMEPDGALYAGIAKHMVQHHDYWNLFADGHDWLDKPHFPFWMMAISFSILGFTTVAYKLPALIFLLLGVVYTYRFAKDLYGEQVARWSVCILLSAEHLIISSTDVRAEPYLTGLIIAAVYHLYKARWFDLLIGALFTACAVMTKGPFAIVPIGCAIAGQFIFTKQWSKLFSWRWLVVAILVVLFITPELYSLYLQFDSHPEKVVFGHTGVSGIRFFFWDSQFGRFMNTGPIKGSGDPTFFLHTALWAFLPWSVFLYTAVIMFIRKGRLQKEYYCISGALSTFLLFSLSKFQLPHYLNIIFPYFSILTAQYILSIERSASTNYAATISGAKGKEPGSMRFFRITQYIIMGIVGAAIVAVWALYQPAIHYFFVLLMLLLVAFYFYLPLSGLSRIFFRTCIASLVLNLFMNGLFYPDVLQYQSGSQAARYANDHLPGQPIGFYKVNSYAMNFYLAAPLERYDSLPSTPAIIFTTPQQRDTLIMQGHACEVIDSFAHFPVTKLDGRFVNHISRPSALGQRLLLRVHPIPKTF
jgi:4-amino-4-deoxy-L-arabinose transferase-like glycosyltransferase